MKKKIYSEIKVLANQLLANGNDLDITTIKQTTAMLYEKLILLEYLEFQKSENKSINEASALDSKSFREENWFQDPKPVPQPQHRDDLAEPLIEKIKDIVAQMPQEGQQVDELLAGILPNLPDGKQRKEHVKNELEEFAEHYKEMPIFERKDTKDNKQDLVFPESNKSTHEKSRSIDEKLNTSLNIGLNDRHAFIKHLFDNNVDDYTRVLSQINTLSSFDAAETFIKGKVKPDYNYWLKKDEYSERFMAIIEKSFN